MRRQVLRGMLACLIAAFAPAAAAAGWGTVLRGSPAEDFNDEDLARFMAAARQTLEASGPPQEVVWRNETSGAGGTMVVIGQPTSKNYGECRRVRMTVYSKKRKGSPFVWTACRDATSRWVLIGAL